MPDHLLKRLARDERGQALVLALAIIVVGMIVGLGAVAYALNVGGSANHDERTRASQQAADAGVQAQLLALSNGSLGYTLSPQANDFSNFANLSACGVPEVSGGQVLGSLTFGVSSGACPIQVPTTCATTASACTDPSVPWSPDSNGSWSETETFPNPQLQGSSSGDFPILFPETVSLGCKTSVTTNAASTCNSPSSAAASRNSYAREMALLNPTAPLQAIEGENDVQIYSPGYLGQTTPASVIDGNIVAGNVLKLPAFTTPVTTLGAFGALTLGGGTAANSPSTQLGGTSGQIASLSGLHPVLDYGYHCDTTPFLGATSTDTCGTVTGVSNGSMSIDQTGSASGPNPCTAGNPSTNCWLSRPAFNLALTSAGAPACPSSANITLVAGSAGGVYSGVPATGGCSNGFLSYTGNVILQAPGDYVFCNIDVGGQIQSRGSGPIQIFIPGQGQDGCSSSGLQVAPTASRSDGYPGLVGTRNVQINFRDGTVGGTAPYTYSWNFGDGATSTAQNPSHVYNDPPGTYIATETVTDASGLAESYAFTVNVTAPLVLGTPSCTLSPASGVICTDTASGGTPGTNGYSYSWNFGDNGSQGDGSSSGTSGAVTSGAISGTTSSGVVTTGFDYANPGTYLVNLTVTDSTGTSQTAKTTLVDSPLTFTSSPTASSPVNQGTATSFSTAAVSGGFGGYTYQWNFGDGGTGTVTTGAASGSLSTATVPGISYRYAYPGIYVATLSVTSADGQTVATYVTNVRVNASSLSESGLTLNTGTIAVTAPTGVASLSTTFTYAAGTCGGTASYNWSFGDGSTSTSQNPPAHTYSSSGTYPARLTVTCSKSGLSSLVQIYAATVVVTASSSPLIPFSTTTGLPPSASTSGSTVTFAGTASGGSGSGYSYSWNFGDGSTGTGSAPSHTYSSAGTYTVVMTVKDSNNNTASYDLTVIVTAAAPSVSLTADTNPIRVGVNPTFTATISGGTTPYASYTLNFGDGSSQTFTNVSLQTSGGNTTLTVPHTYTSAGYYLVTLTVTDAAGQTSSTVYAETVSPTAQSAYGGGDLIASGGINQLATDTATGSSCSSSTCLINGATATSSSVDPAAFQIYMQGNPTEALAPGTSTTDPGALGSFSTAGSYASIGGSGAFIDAFVIYAPRSSIDITAQPPAGSTGGVFEGSAIGWNTSITALMILQDFNLGNYPLSGVISTDSVGRTVECDASVEPLTNTSTDLNGCT